MSTTSVASSLPTVHGKTRRAARVRSWRGPARSQLARTVVGQRVLPLPSLHL